MGRAGPGLPSTVLAGLFDLDGVLTRTAVLHAAAWRTMFDEYLRASADRASERFVPFDPVADYAEYIDGKERAAGVRSFLGSRGIVLPDGDPDDPPGAETVHGLGNRKNLLVRQLMRAGVDAYPGSVRYVRALRAEGLATAVVSASANAREVLTAAGIEGLFDARVDGVTAAERDLRSKPAPDTFLAAAGLLAVPPRAAAVFEDSLAGVTAGRSGGFGLVVGVDRVGRADALRANGADLVVADLAELLEPR